MNDEGSNWKTKTFDWIKSRGFYFWFILILVIIALIILVSDLGDHKMGDLGILDEEHINECEEVLLDGVGDDEEDGVEEEGLGGVGDDEYEEDEVDLIEENDSVVTFGKLDSSKRWKREEMCRQIFETIYQRPFKSCRPDFLKNPKTKRKLELDGYNEELEIAFEHNGKHHYEWPNTFHRTKDDFSKQRYRDNLKRSICDERNIYLITIPFHVPKDEMREFIISKLPKDY